ncbi:helix-turn-helix transcriptional regulator [Streptomyces phaeofaciens JCM 4814]|uniref:HTH-type transcriptional regulator RipA n=1 Tax=Streptomyces phaeofaciens TaxID=68254 RepID=A0A918H961_9ACTN|nr:helix-turn-helix transcriptional regulator [Streptomyces phaeofaciens]GGT45618.1 AraC family transcriptional regulator [Streptomyces phaeofaciens]
MSNIRQDGEPPEADPRPAEPDDDPRPEGPALPRATPSGVRYAPQAPTRAQVLAPGERIDAHRHDDHQIVYAGSGVLAVTTDAGTWFAPGTRALWVPAGTVHAHRAYGHLDLHLVGLPADDNPLGLDTPTALAVSPLLRELIRAHTGAPERPGPERARLLAVLRDQLRVSPRQPMRLPTPSDPRLAAVCALVHADPADRRTLAALGAATGTGERTLSRLFRADLGMTFPQWRTQARLFHALRLLAEDTPVTSVAVRCGWSTASAFIDVFRHTFGHTPGQHRRLPQQAPQRRPETGELGADPASGRPPTVQ